MHIWTGSQKRKRLDRPVLIHIIVVFLRVLDVADRHPALRFLDCTALLIYRAKRIGLLSHRFKISAHMQKFFHVRPPRSRILNSSLRTSEAQSLLSLPSFDTLGAKSQIAKMQTRTRTRAEKRTTRTVAKKQKAAGLKPVTLAKKDLKVMQNHPIMLLRTQIVLLRWWRSTFKLVNSNKFSLAAFYTSAISPDPLHTQIQATCIISSFPEVSNVNSTTHKFSCEISSCQWRESQTYTPPMLVSWTRSAIEVFRLPCWSLKFWNSAFRKREICSIVSPSFSHCHTLDCTLQSCPMQPFGYASCA